MNIEIKHHHNEQSSYRLHVCPCSKSQQSRPTSIYFRITIQGKSTVFSTRKFLIPSKWDPKTRNMGRTKYHDVLYEK
ncbi:Arm DNA-binding domain-containing protein [Sphingobacterium faecium]|uniref:Arm DNA-binding domain-containing protein n=1 Tax=Sphingobacterium faecium TaxID=34087 RepID=UPI003DA32B8B